MGAHLLILLLGGCASSGAAPSPPPAHWSVEEKDAVRLDVVAALIERGRYDLALKAITELRGDGLEGVELDLLQAEALTGQGLYGEAIAQLERVAPRGGAERLKLLGLAYFGQRDIDRSVRAFKRAIRQASRDERAELYNNLGFALASGGRHEEALDAYKRALIVDPSLARARNNAGFSLAALGREEEARASFRAAAEAGGLAGKRSMAEAWYNLGVARQVAGDDAGAVEAWRAAVNMDPEHARARAALDSVAEENP